MVLRLILLASRFLTSQCQDFVYANMTEVLEHAKVTVAKLHSSSIRSVALGMTVTWKLMLPQKFEHMESSLIFTLTCSSSSEISEITWFGKPADRLCGTFDFLFLTSGEIYNRDHRCRKIKTENVLYKWKHDKTQILLLEEINFYLILISHYLHWITLH